MPQTDPRIDAYIAQAPAFAKPILVRIRRLVRKACPAAAETMKWGVPFYEHKGILCGTGAFQRHCNLVFWKWKAIGAPPPKAAPGQFGRIASAKDLPSDAVLLDYIKKAAAWNEANAKPSAEGGKRAKPAAASKRAPKPVPAAPPDFAAALANSKKLSAAYEALAPSHRREYLAWIAEAKREATRARRIEQAVAMIREGKSRHAEYRRPARPAVA